MIAPAENSSTDVAGWVIIEGVRHALWQIGPDRLMLRQSVDFSPRTAEVVLSIDGVEKRMPVFLHAGSSLTAPFVPYRKLADIPPASPNSRELDIA